jgi:hypothetical protein
MNKQKMTNKRQFIKIIICTCIVFAVIICAAYLSVPIQGYNNLSEAYDFAKVITCFFFDKSNTKVPIPLRSVMAVCITLGAFCL